MTVKKGKGQNLRPVAMLLTTVLIIVLSIGSYVLFTQLQAVLFAEKGWLFYQPRVTFLLLMLTEVPLIAAGILILDHFYKREEWKDWRMLFGFLKRFWIPAAVLWCFLMYISLISVTFVTEDRILYRDWIHPGGIIYEYSDVKKVETGYTGSGLFQGKGDFCYKVCVGDRWISFGDVVANEDIPRYEDTWLELEEFDASLMEYHPQKKSSHKNESSAILDQRYLDRFSRIIDNK